MCSDNSSQRDTRRRGCEWPSVGTGDNGGGLKCAPIVLGVCWTPSGVPAFPGASGFSAPVGVTGVEAVCCSKAAGRDTARKIAAAEASLILNTSTHWEVLLLRGSP
eukprot:jgi/Tetstr1/434525/TSEL_023617.t1